MAVVEVEPMSPERTGSQDEKGVWTFTRVFHVRTNDPKDGPFIVLSDPNLPAIYEGYVSGNDNYPDATCRRRGPPRLKDEMDRLNWIVPFEYRQNPENFILHC